MTAATVTVSAVALLNICDYSTRVGSRGQGSYVGAFYGTRSRTKVTLLQAFEIGERDLSLPYLLKKDELYRTIYPEQELVGWFVVGAQGLADWMVGFHRQLESIAPALIVGLFSVPFPSGLTDIPVRTYRLDADGRWTELKVSIEVDKVEQIALNDSFASKSASKTAFIAPLARQTKAALLYHQHMSSIRDFLESVSDGSIDPPVELLTRVTTLVGLLDRPSMADEQENRQEAYKAEKLVVAEALSAIILRLQTQTLQSQSAYN